MKTFEVALDECTTGCLLGYTCTSKKATLPFLIVEWGGGGGGRVVDTGYQIHTVRGAWLGQGL